MPIATESKRVEYKSQYTNDVKKTVVAFANSEGGSLYLGIADDGDVIGLDDFDETLLKVSDSIRNSIKPDMTLLVDYQHEIFDNKNVLKVAIQEGTNQPYYIASKGIRPEGVYIRHGASSVPATESAILKMIKATDGDSFEKLRSINQALTFRYVEKEFRERSMLFEIEQKKSLNIMTGDEVYTNLGLLLSDQCVHTTKVAVFEGNSKEIFKDRREFNGSLLEQLFDTYNYIDMHNKINAKVEGLRRVEQRDYPPTAIREALLNALVHRDYSFSSSILVSIFSNRIELVSVGGLVKGISLDDVMLGISAARNEKLANFMYRLELVEAYGTGIPKILGSYEKSRLLPSFDVSHNAFKITLPNINDVSKATRSFNELSDQEHAVLELLSAQESIVRSDVESLLSISQAMAIRILKSMLEKGVILTTGRGKNTRYRLSQ